MWSEIDLSICLHYSQGCKDFNAALKKKKILTKIINTYMPLHLSVFYLLPYVEAKAKPPIRVKSVFREIGMCLKALLS